MADRPASKGESSSPAQEVKITSQMIAAGVVPLLRFTLDADENEVVAEIYRVMHRLSPKP